jgi:hypothetical protein
MSKDIGIGIAFLHSNKPEKYTQLKKEELRITSLNQDSFLCLFSANSHIIL